MMKFLKYKLKPEFINKSDTKAVVVIEDLEKGFGQTLGNSLRRICLSNISGASMFAIKGPNIYHEFGAIDNVKEDVAEIILNLKRLIIKFKGNEEDMEKLASTNLEYWPVLKIDVKGPCEITSADIQDSEYFEVLNKDLHIATLTSNVNFTLDIYATVGRGFKTSSENKESISVLHIIPTDSTFSPVLGFNYEVEEIKNSKNSTTDKLTITVATNGTISASNVIAMAAKILVAHLEPLIEIDERIKDYQLLAEQEELAPSVSSIPIDELDFSVRAYNALRAENILTLEELVQKTKDEIAQIKNLGRKTVQEIIDSIHARGLKLKDEK